MARKADEKPEVTLEPDSKKKAGSPEKKEGIHYYPPGPVAKAFMADTSFICGIRGPFGSGKSTAAVMKLTKNAKSQKRGVDGWIRRRTAIIRNTYPELRTTTMKTWHQWIPQHVGKWREMGPPCHHIIDPVSKFDWEVLFVALDKPDDVAKLLSMELSDAWINEAREVPKAILDGLTGRVGRYPPRMIAEPTNVQILLDTNPPDTDHWWYVLAEMDTSTEKNRALIQSMKEAEDMLQLMGVLTGTQRLMSFYSQPSGLSEEAENIENLRPGYYQFQIAGKDPDWIKVYIRGEYGFVMDGLPVFPEYKDSTHSRTFPLIPGIGLRLGMDFGLTPAASISQRLANGRWLVQDEFVSERLGIVTFAKELSKFLNERYPNQKITSVRGDPAGDSLNPDESTVFKILQANGFATAVAAPTQDPVRRREAVANLLTSLVDGEPGILLHQRCHTMRKGMSGGYHRKRVQVSGDVRYQDKPEKNKFSHVCEALEYDCVSAGEDRVVMTTAANRGAAKAQYAESDYDVLGGV